MAFAKFRYSRSKRLSFTGVFPEPSFGLALFNYRGPLAQKSVTLQTTISETNKINGMELYR